MIEDLRELLKDKRLHIALGIVKSTSLLSDRSALRVRVAVLPEMREIIATMTWDDVGPNSGDYTFPNAQDLVLLANVDGDEQYSYVIRRLSSQEDKIPLQAADGDKAIVAKSGKKIWISSADRINLSAGSTEPTENVPLGQVLKEFLSDLLEILANHTHVGNMGFETSAPIQMDDILELKDSPVDDEAILSDIAFTEKG